MKKYIPYKHQKNIVRTTREKEYYALFWEQGTGKTKPTIDTACWLYKKGEITALIIIAPNGVHRNWIEQEWEKHGHRDMETFPVIWSNSKTKRFQKQLDLLRMQKTKLKVLSINMDSVIIRRCFLYIQRILKWNKTLIVIDESSKIKSSKAQRTKKILWLSKRFRKSTYRRTLSGTPLTRDLLDLYTQFEFLSPTIFNIPSYYAFKGHYCKLEKQIRSKKIIVKGKAKIKTWEYDDIVGYRNIPELKKKIKKYHSRILKKDCLDLPEKIYQTIPVEMPNKQRRAYNQMEEELFMNLPSLFLEEGNIRENLARDIIEAPEIIARYKLTQIIRLREIVSGFVKNDLGKYINFDSNPKLKALEEDIEIVFEEDVKILIWAYFRYEIDFLTKHFQGLYPKMVSCIHGDIKEKERAYRRKLFQDIDPKAIGHKGKESNLKILVLNPATAGIGFDLNKANYVYYYSNDYNAENRWQSEDRVHRAGLKHPVVYKDIYCLDSIEEDITKNLLGKKKQAEEILDKP